MSRFSEGEGFDSEEDEKEFYERLHAGYTAAVPVLTEFLAYLDAMPKKRIIADRFVTPGSHEMCAVAAFCASRGFEWKKLLEVERDSRFQRLENDGEEECGGWEGPTMHAGVEAGLPRYVAMDLAYTNDLLWHSTVTGESVNIKTKTGYEYSRPVTRAMTPEERWQKLRDHISTSIEIKTQGKPVTNEVTA